MNTKVYFFNELSECFDGIKRQLFDCKYVIEGKLDLLRIICEKDYLTMDQYAGERLLYYCIYLIKICSKKWLIN